jgi:hypothetical protein
MNWAPAMTSISFAPHSARNHDKISIALSYQQRDRVVRCEMVATLH